MSTSTPVSASGSGGPLVLRWAGRARRGAGRLPARAWAAVRRRPVIALGAGLVLAAGVGSLVLRAQERRAVAVAGAMAADGTARAEVDVSSSLRAMKLVTVELPTRVRSAAGDTSWRGDVRAEVSVPARLLMGTDLARAQVSARRVGPAPGAIVGYKITVPPPATLAAELTGGGDERTAVEVGWARFRSRAGEYYLGLARRGLPEAAGSLTLAPGDEAFVRRETRQRVGELVRGIIGADADVVVVFADE